MLAGFGAAFCGDWFLAIQRCDVQSPGFLCGVAAFACAHVLWAAANVRGTVIAWKTLPVVVVPICGFFVARVAGRIPGGVLAAVTAYAAVSAFSFAVAVGTRRWFYALGIGCLVVSDVFIACRWAQAPRWGGWVGPVYLLSLALTAASLCGGRREPRFRCGAGNPLPATLVGGLLSVGFFTWAMAVCPGGGYNPLFRMLSYLGRTEIHGVAYPLCHYLFIFGMASGALATLYFAPYFRAFVGGRVRREVVGWWSAFCAGGLLLIACVPENVNGFWHNAGCWNALFGGVAMLLALAIDRMGHVCLCVLSGCAALFLAATVCDVADWLPFSPSVPTTQKLVIVSFILWQVAYAVRFARCKRGTPR